jgi:hypothetical protein
MVSEDASEGEREGDRRGNAECSTVPEFGDELRWNRRAPTVDLDSLGAKSSGEKGEMEEEKQGKKRGVSSGRLGIRMGRGEWGFVRVGSREKEREGTVVGEERTDTWGPVVSRKKKKRGREVGAGRSSRAGSLGWLPRAGPVRLPRFFLFFFFFLFFCLGFFAF